MTTQIDNAFNYIRSLPRIDFQLESTGNKPGPDAKAAIESALFDFKPGHVMYHHVETAFEGFAGEDDSECTVVNLAKAAIALAADDVAMHQLHEEWGGDVTDGCSFVVLIDG